jgi:hypothetical protein
MLIDSQRGGGLEIEHFRQADPAGNSKTAQGRTQHRESRLVRALRSL